MEAIDWGGSLRRLRYGRYGDVVYRATSPHMDCVAASRTDHRSMVGFRPRRVYWFHVIAEVHVSIPVPPAHFHAIGAVPR